MQLYEKNICRIMIFKLYNVYNKHEMTKIGDKKSQKKKSQVLSEGLESVFGPDGSRISSLGS